MGSFSAYIVVYILGGLTFIPLILALLVLHAYLTLPGPSEPPSQKEKSDNALQHPNDDQLGLKSGTDLLADNFQRTHESDVAAGYFAVCREYVPGGVNGKPPERTTPAGEVVAAGSPSVYQSMYRSIFDRKQPPTIDPAGGNGKKARNVFFVILRHGHLMLYDDSEQLEVRHVISLAHHDVSVYGGGNTVPEGELWIKRNAICLTRRMDSIADLRTTPPPFYLFSENCSEKEDFYFAMLKNQEKIPDSPNCPPTSQHYNVNHIISLVQRLHSSEKHLQTRWINAMMGRLFLAVYKTPEMEDFLRKKITKKISRVKKPNFITQIGLQKIDPGEGAPLLTNPRLKDLTIDGDCCVETDINYSGNFRVEVAATARIDLGSRFKAREVDLVLAVVLKKLTGHVLVRFKPPPSNRIWVSFETMPNMEMAIEPIVSSRQITYGIILRAIESRIREVVAETLVQPFWDDVPFLDTTSQQFRGGIWERDTSTTPPKTVIPDEQEEEIEGDGTAATAATAESLDILKDKDDRTMSMPILPDSPQPALKSRKNNKSASPHAAPSDFGASSGIERSNTADPPRALRSQTFSVAANPVVTADNVKVDHAIWGTKKKENKDATSAIMEISNRSNQNSPARTPVGSPTNDLPSIPPRAQSGSISSNGSTEDFSARQRSPSLMTATSAPLPSSSGPKFGSRGSLNTEDNKHHSPAETLSRTSTSTSTTSTEKRQAMAALGTATAAAKKWGLNVLGRGDQSVKGSDTAERPGVNQPMGRGRPLPPPGTPLPPPERSSFKSAPISITKRKPLPPPLLPERDEGEERKSRPVPKPPLPARRKTKTQEPQEESFKDELFVVEAPQDSNPTSPAHDQDAEFVEQMEIDDDHDPTETPKESSSETSSRSRELVSPANFERTSSSPEDGPKLPSWVSAEEEEARSRSLWVHETENQHS
ncbi:hypothetical protein FQN54_004861 [Arachnomyces sp. PD_36]|nr:hypothetical protein FQN54_004861 [Arachnomyces sp. PD_36]